MSEEQPAKSKRTSTRGRGLSNPGEEISGQSSQRGSTAAAPAYPTAASTSVPSATAYSLSAGLNGGVAGNPTVIVSIPDTPQPKPNVGSPKKSRPSSAAPQRRQAILVEAVPPSKKTTPKRVSTSRAKPRSRTGSSGHSVPNGTGSTGNVADFVMPSTPKKIPGSSAASIRANSRLNKPRRDLSVAPSENKKESPAAVQALPNGTTSTPLVTAPTIKEFNIDIAALLDRVHKLR